MSPWFSAYVIGTIIFTLVYTNWKKTQPHQSNPTFFFVVTTAMLTWPAWFPFFLIRQWRNRRG